jgi:predicted nucleic acid-binding protein
LTVLSIDQNILDEAVTLRQKRKTGIGDALIAATAIVHDLTLYTHNTDDFKWIPELRVTDPLA